MCLKVNSLKSLFLGVPTLCGDFGDFLDDLLDAEEGLKASSCGAVQIKGPICLLPTLALVTEELANCRSPKV